MKRGALVLLTALSLVLWMATVCWWVDSIDLMDEGANQRMYWKDMGPGGTTRYMFMSLDGRWSGRWNRNDFGPVFPRLICAFAVNGERKGLTNGDGKSGIAHSYAFFEGSMRILKSVLWRCSLFAILLLGSFIQGCCGIGGLNESQVRQWIHKGDSGDKVLAFLKSEGFEVDDNRLSSEQARRIREGGRDATHPSSGWINGTRMTDVCALIETHLNVIVGIDANNQVTDEDVMKVVIPP